MFVQGKKAATPLLRNRYIYTYIFMCVYIYIYIYIHKYKPWWSSG